MKYTRIVGIIFLVLAYLWLAWAIIAYAGGWTLKNILLLAMSATIIFVPIYKKYSGKEK